MPFGSDNSLDQLSAPPHWSLGPTSSLGDQLTASYNRQRIADSAFGMQIDVRDEYLGQMDRIRQATGQNPDPNWAFALDGISAGITRQVGQQIGFQAPVFTDLQQQAQKEYLAAIDRMDQAITQGKQSDPSLKTFSEVFQDALKRRQDALQTAQSVGERAGVNPIAGAQEGLAIGEKAGPLGAALGATTGAVAGLVPGVASFLGQTAAAANPLNFQQDPLWVASMFLPAGKGASLAMKLLESAITSGAASGAQDIMFAGPRARALGEQSPDLFSDVLSGAIGALAFKGLHEAIPVAYRDLVGAPAKASPEAALYDFLSKAEPDLSNVTDQNTLLRLFRQLPYSEGNAAADANLTNEFMTRETSPFPDDRAGVAATQEAVTNAYDVFNNGPEGARVFNPDSTIFATGPTEDQVVRDVVSQKTPEVYDKLDQVKTELTDAQTRLEQAVATYQQFSTGKDFDLEVQKVKDQLNSGLAEVEQIRKEGRQSPNHPDVVGEIQRLKDQATKQIVDIGSTRFATKTMLQGELKDARAKVAAAGKRLKRAGAAVAAAEAEARKTVKGTVPEPKVEPVNPLGARPDVSGRVKAVEAFKPEDEVERVVKTAQASAKEALAALEEGKKGIPLYRGVPKDRPDNSAFYTGDRKVAERYSKMTGSTAGGHVVETRGFFKKALQVNTLADAYKELGVEPSRPDRPFWVDQELMDKAKAEGYDVISIGKGSVGSEHIVLDKTAVKPVSDTGAPMFNIGNTRISTDLQVPGPDSLRSALKVMEEIQDEQDLKDAATRCGLGG